MKKKVVYILNGRGLSGLFTDHEVHHFYTGQLIPISIEKMPDVIVYSGGADINPELYGEKRHPLTGNPDLERDAWEAWVFYKALRYGIPMVGICRGAQFLTAMSGGKLIQHVEKHAISGTHKIFTHRGDHIQVTSTHHQMMDPYGLSPSEYRLLSLSFLIKELAHPEPEVVWYPITKSLAVQYHPEYMADDTEGWKYFQQLLEEFVL